MRNKISDFFKNISNKLAHKETVMESKIILALVLLSVAFAIIFAGRIIYNHSKIHYLTIATASEWGEYYKFGKALAKVVNKYHPRIQIRVQRTNGSEENLQLLQSGQVDFAIAQNNVLADVSTSKQSIRTISSLFPEVFHIIVAKNSGIHNISQLKGKKIAIVSGGSGSQHLFFQILDYYGLTKKDVVQKQLIPSKIASMLKSGEIDAISHTLALGNKVVRDLIKETGANLLKVEQINSMQVWLPYLEATTIPIGIYHRSPATPKQDLSCASVRAMLLTHKDVNKHIIYEITSTLHQHRADLVAKYPYAAKINPYNLQEYLTAPLHPGSQSYYNKNRPAFIVRYAEVIALFLSILIFGISGLIQLRIVLRKSQKEKADKHNLEILELVEQAHTANCLEKLEDIRQKLLEIFRQVIEELDQDQISQDSFQSFAFSWEVAIKSINHREMILK